MNLYKFFFIFFILTIVLRSSLSLSLSYTCNEHDNKLKISKDLSNERSCHQKPENTKKNDICFECDCNYFPISTEVVLEDINFDNFYVPIDLLILNTYPFTNKIIYPPPKTSLFLSL